jgi:hypothetical protein
MQYEDRRKCRRSAYRDQPQRHHVPHLERQKTSDEATYPEKSPHRTTDLFGVVLMSFDPVRSLAISGNTGGALSAEPRSARKRRQVLITSMLALFDRHH